MATTITECKSEVGITVGLIDSLIAICRVLAPRLKMTCGDQEEQPIVEAMRDLSQDKAVCWVWDHRPYSQDEQMDAKLMERVKLFRKRKRTSREEERLLELNAFVESIKYPSKAGDSRFSETFNDLVRKLVADLPGGFAAQPAPEAPGKGK